MTKFLNSADSLQTSQEIIDAIWQVARGNEAEAMRMWEEPTSGELVAISEIATKNGRIEQTDLCWGASGTEWATYL